MLLVTIDEHEMHHLRTLLEDQLPLIDGQYPNQKVLHILPNGVVYLHIPASYYAYADGIAQIKLNGWESGLIDEESRRSDFVCWLRNPPREKWSMCMPYYFVLIANFTICHITQKNHPFQKYDQSHLYLSLLIPFA